MEDFVCKNCGNSVTSNGYTNHCPECLWSKHVDVNPGDRAETCRGMMEPISIEHEGQTIYIVHKCAKCGHQKRNKRREEDNFETILAVMKQTLK